MDPYSPRPLTFVRRPPDEMQARARDFRAELSLRRSVRQFSREPVPEGVIEDCIAAAGTAPSGANQQPWTFVLVSDPALKQQIRAAAEAEEQRNYAGRMSAEWRAAVAPLGTDAEKPHITDAPHLIVVFEQAYGLEPAQDPLQPPGRVRHYYVDESVGIAVGFLLAALHHAGLATLAHTPSPMNFLRTLLERPENERAFLLIPVGFPAADALVPAIERKPLDAVLLRR
jgi:iodotyrosine deiodinase